MLKIKRVEDIVSYELGYWVLRTRTNEATFYVHYSDYDCTGFCISIFKYNKPHKVEFDLYFEEEGYLFFDFTFKLFSYVFSISMFS